MCNIGSEDIPEIPTDEIRIALELMKNRKCSGEDNITREMLKKGGTIIEKSLHVLLNKRLYEGKVAET